MTATRIVAPMALIGSGFLLHAALAQQPAFTRTDAMKLTGSERKS